LEILEFVHNHEVIHRDIKPSNLIRRKQDGRIVLIDFGAVKTISHLKANSQEQNTLTIPIGTPGYSPPEQMSGNPKFNSDIYALGVLCIQALTGADPYQIQIDSNTGSWYQKIQVNPELVKILDKMVRYDFKHRYQSAQEVMQDLNSLTSIAPETSGSSQNTMFQI
jgi:serine/threonine protein kinase